MRRVLLGLIPLAAVLLAAGCASAPAGSSPTGGGASTNAVGPPTTSTPAGDVDAAAAWLDGGRLIGLVTYGSSSCVPMATDAAVGPTGTLTVTLTDPVDTACTRDYAPRVTVVAVPGEVDPSNDVEIALAGDYAGDTELDGEPGLSPSGETDYQPSAGWTGEDDQLVILTWGSSGCPPVVQSVDVLGPAQLTVTFETPPADQICTADIAPRAVLVAAEGLEDDVAAQLTLAGGREFATPVTIPVYGTP